MWFGIVTLFPEMVKLVSQYGVLQRAVASNLLELTTWNPRDFTTDPHKTVDDRPYGGGAGMVMKAPPVIAAINAAKQAAATASAKGARADDMQVQVIGLSPQGRKVNQADIQQLSAGGKPTVLVAGRYEGIDERVYTIAIDHKWSIGDYVITGGELAAMVIIDAATRLLPGVLGNAESKQQDVWSSEAGLLDYPQYTRPRNFAGLEVPKVLLSGDHQAIAKWRNLQAKLEIKQEGG